ncbi:hypothetical protein JCM3765_000597 [Sporobolomyces pararoseus]
MSERPSRPRRSAAATSSSYTHLLQPINLTSSSSSSNDDDNDSDSDSTKRKKRLKKKKTSFIPEQESDSEFEIPVKPEQGEEEDDDEDDDEDLLLEVGSEEEDDGPSGQGEEDMSDIATSGGEIDQGSPDPKTRGGGKGKTRNNKPLEYSSNGKQPRRSLVITKGTLPPLDQPEGEGGRGEFRRALPNRTILSGLDSQYSSFVPHYLPPQIKLSSTPTSTYSTAKIETSKKPTKGQTDKDSSSLLEEWTANPFAPERALVRDVGWYKGKWKETQDQNEEGEGESAVMNEKWGGWYQEIKFDENKDFEKVQQHEIDSRLPSQTFHARPIPFHKLTVSKTQEASKPSENANGTEDTSATEETAAGVEQLELEEEENGKRKVFVGDVNGEGEQEITLNRFESIPLNSFLPRKPGHLINVGGPVAGLSWLPRLNGPSTKEYLAISTISSPSLTLSHPPNLTDSKLSSMIQIWSLYSPHPEKTLTVETKTTKEEEEEEEDEEIFKFEIGLLCGENEGEAKDLQWCPRGGTLKTTTTTTTTGDEMDLDNDQDNEIESESRDSLGVLAGVFTDGKIKVFVVPGPERVREKQGGRDETVYLKAKKVLELALPNTSCLSFSWGSWETIAAGCLNGYIAVWYVGDALRKGLSNLRPTHYLPVHSCAIRSIAFVNSPPPSNSFDSNGSFNLSGDPNRIAAVGYDGSTTVTDLREVEGAGSAVFLHERSATYSVAFSPQSGCIYADDQDDRIRAYFLKSLDYGLSKRIGAHRGTIWSLATSDHHPFVLSSSSDGTVSMHSGVRALRRRRVRGHFSQKLYSIEFEREIGKWRMRDNFQVEHRTALDSVASGGGKAATSGGEVPLTSIVAWPQEVQLNKVCWHPNLERSALVASGGNWGCVRIDCVEGVGER